MDRTYHCSKPQPTTELNAYAINTNTPFLFQLLSSAAIPTKIFLWPKSWLSCVVVVRSKPLIPAARSDSHPKSRLPLSQRYISICQGIAGLRNRKYPTPLNLPTLKTYNGTTDPDSHINTYEWTMRSLKLDERFWCTYFPTTLDGNADTWFKTLRPGIISNFA